MSAPRVVQSAVPVVAVAILLAGLTGLTPAPAALAIAVGGTSIWAGTVLVRAALGIHHRDRTFDACRGAGFVGCGAFATGLAGLAPLAGLSTPVAVALFGVVAVLHCTGTLMLPGSATSWHVHLRRAFDGLGLGVSLGFASYVAPPVKTHLGTLPVLLIGCAGISVITITVLRVRPRRWATVRCGTGGVTVLAALGVLTTYEVLGPLPHGVLWIGLPIVAGLALTAEGGSRRDLPPLPIEPRYPDQYLASYPLLAVPATLGVLAAIWHVIVVRTFHTTGVLLGIAMVAVLIMREMLVVSDVRRYAGQLRTAEAHFRSLVAGATDLTLVLDERQRITWKSPAAAHLFGLDDEVIGRRFRDLLHPDDVTSAQAVIDSVLAGEHLDGPPALVTARLRDGAEMWRDTESTITDQRAVPEVAALVVHVRDIGERRHLERTLHKLTSTDQLTGLANRRALMSDLLAHRRRAGQRGTLLVVDLHGVAEINDTRGREIGDAVLTEVGRRIRALLGEQDVAARLGGDEFAVLTADGSVFAYALAIRITSALAEPFELPGATVRLHTSVGLAEVSGGADSDEVLRHADLARRRALQLGLDRVEWYDPDVEMALNRRMDLEKELVGAAERGELDLVFQPVTGLGDRQPAGVEALLRWRHPGLGTILPGEMLPIARSMGLSGELDAWVLDTACRQLTTWATGDDTLWVSVNVTPRELLTARFPERVETTLRRYGLAPERLVIEVAETWVAEDVPAIVASLSHLRRMGVRAALDDFGAGQASLSHLRRLPVDMLKLHQSLIAAAPEPVPGGGPAVIDVVVSLGRRLGLEIVAKGLETDGQIEAAIAAGCRFGQGYALGRPAPAERVEAYIATHRGLN